MVGANVTSGVAQAVTAALLITDRAEVWHLAALAAVNGASTAFYFPASAGVVPQTVPVSLLQQANALLQLAMNTAMIGGAAVAGFLVAGIGPGGAIVVDAATFFLAALLLGSMRLPEVVREQARGFASELAVGWREFRSRTWLWAIVAQFSLMLMVVLGAFTVLGPVVADEELGGPTAWGLILTGWSAGLVTGGLIGLRYRPRRMLLAATLSILVLPLPLVALGFPLSVPAIAAVAFVAGVGNEIFGLLWHTTMQQEIPPDKLSRVYSYDALGSIGLVPLGYALAGPAAEAFGVQATLWGAAAISVGVTLAVLLVRDVRTLERRVTPSPSPTTADLEIA
jgi:predicted MFS family arabinose efflux permease